MIQPNELRIGNFIKGIHDDELFIVTGIKNRVAKEVEAERMRDNQYIGWCFLSIFEPIDITPEWITRLGLKETTMLGVCDYFNLKDGWFGIMSNGNGYFKFSIMQGSIGSQFKHVHQLQNLYFALTGKELSLTPNT